jgi:hypothetical protein
MDEMNSNDTHRDFRTGSGLSIYVYMSGCSSRLKILLWYLCNSRNSRNGKDMYVCMYVYCYLQSQGK